MARPAGVRNHDFDSKRAALLNRLTDYALNADLRRPSLRQFALAVEASEPTLRHYFTDRAGLVVAILENIGARGRAIWAVTATPSSDVGTALAEYYRIALAGMQHGGFVRAHAFGLIEGAADAAAGEAYLANVLEPALNAIGRKLEGTPGAPSDPVARRCAALAMLSPLLALSLHQDLLGGRALAAMKADDLATHLERWLAAGFTGDRAAP